MGKKRVPPETLSDLVSIGPAALEDFKVLGIDSLEELKECNAKTLYDELFIRTNVRHDPCVEDVFACAIAQAKDPNLPAEQKQWFYWSKLRKRT